MKLILVVIRISVEVHVITGDTPGDSCWGCAARTLFQTQNAHFSFLTPFFRPGLLNLSVFRPGLQEIRSSLLRLEQQRDKKESLTRAYNEAGGMRQRLGKRNKHCGSHTAKRWGSTYISHFRSNKMHFCN